MSRHTEPFDETLYEQSKEQIRRLELDFAAKAATTSPVCRDSLERAVSRIYGHWGLEAPATFLYFESPASAVVAVLLLTDLFGFNYHRLPVPRVAKAVVSLTSRTPPSTLDLHSFLQFAIQEEVTVVDPQAAHAYHQWWTNLAALKTPTKDIDLDRITGATMRMDYVDRVAALLSAQLSASSQSSFDPSLNLEIEKKLWSEERRARLKFQRSYNAETEAMVPEAPVEVSRRILWSRKIIEELHSPLTSGYLLYHLVGRLLNKADARVNDYIDAFEAGGWWFALDKICVVSENPLVMHLDGNNPGHESEPAISFADWDIWALGGRRVPESVVTRTFTIKDIHNERNVELRRLMIDRFGLGNFIRESGARKLQTDECGTLYRIEMQADEPVTVVQVTNKTPEPDGSYKVYHLRVPPDVQTARQAVAWSFNLDENEYEPLVET